MELFKLKDHLPDTTILDKILNIKLLNNYYSPVLINKDYGIFNEFNIKNFIICRLTNGIYYELFNNITDESSFRLFELKSNFTFNEIVNTTKLNKIPLKNTIFDYLKIQDTTFIPGEHKNYILNYLSGLFSTNIGFNVDNIIQVLDIGIIKDKFSALHNFIGEFITYGNNKMIIYKNSNLLNMYILMGKPIYFLKVIELFNKMVIKKYENTYKKKSDSISNITGSYTNIAILLKDLDKKMFTYNDKNVSKELMEFITEFDLLFSTDINYILDYYNYCKIYEINNMLFKNKDIYNHTNFRSFDEQLKKRNKIITMDYDSLKVNLIIENFTLYLKYYDAYNIPSNNDFEHKQYKFVIKTILDYIFYYQIENLPFLINKNEIISNLYGNNDLTIYSLQSLETSPSNIEPRIGTSLLKFYKFFNSDEFIILKQDYMAYGNDSRLMCGEATIINLFNYLLFDEKTKKINPLLLNNINIGIKQFYIENNTFELIEKNRNVFQRFLYNIPHNKENFDLYSTKTNDINWEIRPDYNNICFILSYLSGKELIKENITGNTLKDLLNDIFIIDQKILDTYDNQDYSNIKIGNIKLALNIEHSSFNYGNFNSERKKINILVTQNDFVNIKKYFNIYDIYGLALIKDYSEENDVNKYDIHYRLYLFSPFDQYEKNHNFIYWYYFYNLYNSFFDVKFNSSFITFVGHYNCIIEDKLRYNNNNIVDLFIMYFYTLKDFKKEDKDRIKNEYNKLIKLYTQDTIKYILNEPNIWIKKQSEDEILIPIIKFVKDLYFTKYRSYNYNIKEEFIQENLCNIIDNIFYEDYPFTYLIKLKYGHNYLDFVIELCDNIYNIIYHDKKIKDLECCDKSLSESNRKYIMYGGSEAPHPNLDISFMKYLKYKNKYLQLKKY